MANTDKVKFELDTDQAVGAVRELQYAYGDLADEMGRVNEQMERALELRAEINGEAGCPDGCGINDLDPEGITDAAVSSDVFDDEMAANILAALGAEEIDWEYDADGKHVGRVRFNASRKVFLLREFGDGSKRGETWTDVTEIELL